MSDPADFLDHPVHHERNALRKNAAGSKHYSSRAYKRQVVIAERFSFYANNKISEWIESIRILVITAYCKANDLNLVIHDSRFDNDDEHVVSKPIQERGCCNRLLWEIITWRVPLKKPGQVTADTALSYQHHLTQVAKWDKRIGTVLKLVESGRRKCRGYGNQSKRAIRIRWLLGSFLGLLFVLIHFNFIKLSFGPLGGILPFGFLNA